MVVVVVEPRPGASALGQQFKSDLFDRPPWLDVIHVQFHGNRSHFPFNKTKLSSAKNNFVKLFTGPYQPSHGRSFVWNIVQSK